MAGFWSASWCGFAGKVPWRRRLNKDRRQRSAAVPLGRMGTGRGSAGNSPSPAITTVSDVTIRTWKKRHTQNQLAPLAPDDKQLRGKSHSDACTPKLKLVV